LAEPLVARVSITIDAPRAKVWDAFVNPETMRKYMSATSIVSDWREGSPIVWKSEWLGKPFESRGTITRLDPPSELEYTYSPPTFRASRVADANARYHRVTIKLSDEGTQTRVSVVQDYNRTARELEHTEGGWRHTLHNLKALLEGTRQ
jgi:uncharacterized protein YndB with AHSA1/START domain